MATLQEYSWCFHGAWTDGNFGDDLLRISAVEVVKMAEEKLHQHIFTNFANPVFLGGNSCNENAHLHIFWSGTQHFFHLSNWKQLLQNAKTHYWQIPKMFRQNQEFSSWLIPRSYGGIVFIGSGFGPFSLPFLPARRILKKYLRNASLITVRDQKSAAIIKPRPKVTSDPVASLLISMDLSKGRNLHNAILLSPRLWNSRKKNKRQRSMMTKLIQVAELEKLPVRFFFANQSDFETWVSILGKREYRIWDSNDYKSSFDFIADHSHVITSRWHVAMVARFLGASVLVMDIEQKMRSLGPYAGKVVSRLTHKRARREILNPGLVKSNPMIDMAVTLEDLSSLLISTTEKLTDTTGQN